MKHRDKGLIYYYVVLLFMLFTWSSPVSLPPLPLRLLYCLFLLAPVVYRKHEWLPIVLTTFITISMNRMAPSYMPSVPSLITVLLLFVLLITQGYRLNHIKTPYFLYVLLLWICFVDFFCAQKVHFVVYTLINVIILFKYLVVSSQNKNLFIYSFIVISLVLSFELIINGANFTDTYSSNEIERIGWRDPNIFASIIGMGIFASMVLIIQSSSLLNKGNIICYVTIVLSLVACLKTASRGASLAILVSTAILILISNINRKRKLGILIGGVLLLGALYQLGAFDTLSARFALENTETGGERTIIWGTRFRYFIQDNGLSHWIFGYGLDKGCNLGFSSYVGFHSDFVAFFIQYGVVGFILFVYMFVYPIIYAKQNRPIVIAGVVYLIICSMTLDLFGSGNMSFYAFYMFLILLSKS